MFSGKTNNGHKERISAKLQNIAGDTKLAP